MLGLLKLLGFGERRCAHCHFPYFTEDAGPEPACESLCPACLAALAPARGACYCRSCGVHLIDPRQTRQPVPICRACATQGAPWSGIAFHGAYKGVLRDLILRLKFDAQLPLARVLANLLCNASACLSRPDAIVPIPQHPLRLRQRGYNQAHELAREVARQTGLPFRPRLLRRTVGGLPQEGLSASERRRNLARAFTASDAGRLHIWLVDDVFTSGSTARSATEALLKAGASSVQLLFVARTDFS